MPRGSDSFNDVLAFVHVVREGSFTRAAALLGVSPSALSHAVKGLEARLGVQLLTRTTRRIATTEAGDRLYTHVAPRFEQIDAEVAAVVAMGDKPAGTIRITAAEHAVNSVLWPKLSPVLHQHPDIHVEISVDYALSDIVAQRFDAGVRLGDQVARDMIAVRISADQRMAVVASPAYFATRPRPATPADLAGHNCINLRLPTHAHAVQPVAAVQNEYSVLERSPERDTLAVCRELGIGFVPWAPLARGFNTGRFGIGTRFLPGDYRGGLPRMFPDAMPANLQLIALLERWGAAKQATPAQISLAWLLAQGTDIVPIPGSTDPWHMIENLRGAEVAFTPEELVRFRGELEAIAIVGPRGSPQSMAQNGVEAPPKR